MNNKTDVDVIIAGKQITISGYESNEYINRIASHINEKMLEFRQQEGFLRMDADTRSILLAINLSDDYHKLLDKMEDIKKEDADMEKQILDMKHKMIEMQKKLAANEAKIRELKAQKNVAEKQNIRYEAELEHIRKAEEKKSKEPEQLSFVASENNEIVEKMPSDEAKAESAKESKESEDTKVDSNVAKTETDSSSTKTEPASNSAKSEETATNKDSGDEAKKDNGVAAAAAASLGKHSTKKSSRSSRSKRK